MSLNGRLILETFHHVRDIGILIIFNQKDGKGAGFMGIDVVNPVVEDLGEFGAFARMSGVFGKEDDLVLCALGFAGAGEPAADDVAKGNGGGTRVDGRFLSFSFGVSVVIVRRGVYATRDWKAWELK
jgi:hypothetical protein